MFPSDLIATYWSHTEIATNLVILLHLGGALLLDKMIQYLKGRGTRRMVALVLPDNRAMLELATSAGMVVDKAGSDSDALHLVLTLAH